MTENAFTVGYFDEPTDIDDYIECNGEYLSSSEAVELLNELYEERNYFERKKCEYWNKFNLTHLDNIDLRKENEQLYELLDFANTLFAFEASESCQKKWEKRLEEEWKKRLKELKSE